LSLKQKVELIKQQKSVDHSQRDLVEHFGGTSTSDFKPKS